MAIVNGITYDSDNNIIYVEFVDDDVKGDDFSSAYNFQDIYDTDQDKGWGVFHQPYDRMFNSEADIYIKGADTYFKDSGFILNFTNGGGTLLFYVKYDANIEIDGNRSVFINRSLAKVITFRGNNSQTYNNIDIIGFNRPSNSLFYGGTFKNIYLSDGNIFEVDDSNWDIDNLYIYNYTNGLDIQGNTPSLNNVQIIGCSSALNLQYSYENKGFYLSNNTYDLRFFPRSGNFTIGLANSTVDIDSYIVGRYDAAEMFFKLKQYFQIYIENAANASVTLYDKNGNTVISGTLDSEGKWLLTDPITWVQRYVETDGSSVVENTKTEYEPFKLVIKKNGLQTLTIPNIYCSIYDSEKDKRIGSLEDTVVEGQMVGKNYIDGRIQQQIQEDKIQLQLQEETITFKAYDAS